MLNWKRGATWIGRGANRAIAAAGAAALILALTAGRASAQAAPGGIRVSGCDIHDVTGGEPSTPAEINIAGARNGGYSGEVVVHSTQPIKGLHAAISDLRQGGNTIPVTALQVRYGAFWEESRANRPQGCDVLLESPLPEFSGGRVIVFVTVQIPSTAKPGAYAGQLTVQAAGMTGPVQVPVKLDVHNFTLPDPQDYRTWIETVKSPDTLSLEYNVPLWSDQHWTMVAKELKLVSITGDRTVYIPLIAGTNYGNAESMVRWIKKPGGGYDYDFGILDKYLDAVAKNLGTPKLIMLHAWEQYLMKPKGDAKPVEVKGAEGSYDWREAMAYNARLAGKGPAVTLFDPTTKKTESVNLPRYEDPQSLALWKPVWDGVRQRIAKHGWEKTMMVGNMVDYYPTPEETKVLNQLSGGLPWACCAHHLPSMKPGVSLGKLHGIADIGYAAVALDEEYNLNPAKATHLYGWKEKPLYAHYFRFQVFNSDSLPDLHNIAERLISANKRGIGHIGADFWPCIKARSGRYLGTVTDRYPESYWHSLNIMGFLLAPGQTGPVGTVRLEIFREGIENCEARIAIESALSDPALKSRLGDDLAKRVQDYLDDRQVGIWKAIGVQDADIEKHPLITYYRDWIFDVAKRVDAKAGTKWYLASGWQDRDAKLYDLASEVVAKVGGASTPK